MNAILHIPSENRFEMEVNSQKAYLEYVIDGVSLDITHTVVPKELSGRGIAAALVEAAYQYGEQLNLKPQATCSYAAAWRKRNIVVCLKSD